MLSASDTAEFAGPLLASLRQARPLVHNITNFVSMDVAANALLAIGASPAMVHAPEEVVEFLRLTNALVINIGTLSQPWVESMLMAAAAARTLNKPCSTRWASARRPIATPRWRRCSRTLQESFAAMRRKSWRSRGSPG
jgi:hypothetical protein